MSRPGSTTARGYGQVHRNARTAALARHHPFHPCPRCALPLGPAYGYRLVKTRGTIEYGSLLDYDHDGTRTGYIGLSHAGRCNRAAGARTANRNRALRRVVYVSRSW